MASKGLLDAIKTWICNEVVYLVEKLSESFGEKDFWLRELKYVVVAYRKIMSSNIVKKINETLGDIEITYIGSRCVHDEVNKVFERGVAIRIKGFKPDTLYEKLKLIIDFRKAEWFQDYHDYFAEVEGIKFKIHDLKKDNETELWIYTEVT